MRSPTSHHRRGGPWPRGPARPAALASVLAALVVLGGCGDDDSGSSGVRVSATTGIVADITSAVAGPDAEVTQVIPDSVSPHDVSLSARDRAGLEDADLVVANGAGLEAGIPLDEVNAPRFELTDHVGELRHGDDGDSFDPHVWMDPTRVARALPALADALAEVDPEHAAGYRRRAEGYAAELRTLDAQIERKLAAVPGPDRGLVTSHDALGYLADRYGFELIGAPFPATGPEAEPSAATIRDLEDEITSSGVPAVFAEETDDPEVLRQLAEATGVEVVTELLVESPGDAGGYVEMLRRDAELIRRALISGR